MDTLSKSNQRFTGSDAFSVVVLGLTTLGIALSILTEAFQDDTRERAQAKAESLAHQMASAKLAVSEEMPDSAKIPSSNRGPASVSKDSATQSVLSQFEGKLGLDPWGQPFHYKLLRSAENKTLRIVVWSNGPDKIPNTNFPQDEAEMVSPRTKLSFQGDDVGYVYLRK